MDKMDEDEAREHRIAMETVVDCYDPAERAIGWHCYLDDHLAFPFRARCVEERPVSPLRKGEEVEVTGLADLDEDKNAMFVLTEWEGRSLGVPLAQLAPVDVDAKTAEAISDWRYWVGRGYRFF
jgi:hypothetical protein